MPPPLCLSLAPEHSLPSPPLPSSWCPLWTRAPHPLFPLISASLSLNNSRHDKLVARRPSCGTAWQPGGPVAWWPSKLELSALPAALKHPRGAFGGDPPWCYHVGDLIGRTPTALHQVGRRRGALLGSSGEERRGMDPVASSVVDPTTICRHRQAMKRRWTWRARGWAHRAYFFFLFFFFSFWLTESDSKMPPKIPSFTVTFHPRRFQCPSWLIQNVRLRKDFT